MNYFTKSIQTSYEQKAFKEAEAYELATGTYRIKNNGSVLPLATDSDSKMEFERIANLVTSVGPKILNRKIDGIIGSFSINGSNTAKKIIDQDYDLPELTERVARDLVVKGSAGLAIGVDENDEPYLYRLGGHIARITNQNDVDKELGIMQMEQNWDGSWEIHFYFDNVVQHWTKVTSVNHFTGENPDNEYENRLSQVAFFADYNTDDTNTAMGEVEQVSPILKGIIAVEARIHRVSEIYGYPVAVISGQVQESEHGPSNAMHVSEGGSVNYLTPADFQNLINQKKDLLAELNEVSTLPSGFLGTGNQPSGEAIREANTAFNNSLDRYSSIISRLLTNGFSALFEALSVDSGDFVITLYPNRVVDEDGEIANMIGLLEKGLLPVKFVVQKIRQRYSGMTDEMAEEVIQSYERANSFVTPDDLLQNLE